MPRTDDVVKSLGPPISPPLPSLKCLVFLVLNPWLFIHEARLETCTMSRRSETVVRLTSQLCPSVSRSTRVDLTLVVSLVFTILACKDIHRALPHLFIV